MLIITVRMIQRGPSFQRKQRQTRNILPHQAESGESEIIFLILAFLSLIFFVSFPINHAFASDKHLEKAVFSIRANNETLIKILEKISNASGYVIVVNTELGDTSLSIQLSNVTIHEAIKRILAKYNHFSLWDENKKRLDLYVFDSKGPPVSLSGKQIIFEPGSKTTIY